MAFALALSLLTGIVFASFPALRASCVDMNAVFMPKAWRCSGLRQNKARAALVISEVSLAVVLLVGSALLIRTFVALYKLDHGFQTKNVVTLQTSLTGPNYAKSAGVAATVRDALERVRSVPGVIAASASACCVPLRGDLRLPFDIVGRPANDQPHTGGGGWTTISPGYFDVFKIPVKRGRVFTDRDDATSPPVVVINERMAKEFWKDSNPLNDRIVIGKGAGDDYEDHQVRQIIGIVGDVRQDALESVPGPRMYVPQAQLPDAIGAYLVRIAPTAWLARTQSNTEVLVTAIQEQLRQATGLPCVRRPFHG